MVSLFSRSHQSKKDRKLALLVTPEKGDRRIVGLSKTWNGAGTPAATATNGSSHSKVGEFGTVPHATLLSHGSHLDPPLTPPRSLTPPSSPPIIPPKYSFFMTQLPPSAPTVNSIDSFSYGTDEVTSVRPYGFLGGIGKEVVLGLDEVARVIRDVGGELGHRALDTPMLFSNQSLDLNATRMRKLIKAFLATVSSSHRTPHANKLEAFAQDVQFANDHELAWLLRWALSRMTRVREGTCEVCHGCIEWDVYEEWRGRERAANYPLDAFPYLSRLLPSDVYRHIVAPLFNLLSRFSAHSHISGLTPHSLASLFAPLLFEIPTSAPCLTAHASFVRAASATEHLLLANIRSSWNRDGLGITDLPFRLQEWVKGYPCMVASDSDLARGRPRRGSRLVRCVVATRDVRAYSRDLIVQSESWVRDIPSWDEWDRVVIKTRRGDDARPKFSAAWRRKMAVKETPPLPASSMSGIESTEYGTVPFAGLKLSTKIINCDDGDEGKWDSMAGKEWSAFEESGFDSPQLSPMFEFGAPGDMRSRLQFDMTESAKMSIAERRQTMDWTDFAAPTGGFTRTEPYLTASLTFSAPVESSITDWPRERDELRKRLHKTQKEATPFTYDTNPRTGAKVEIEGADHKGRVYVEEAFVDCWADLMLGAGWMDREELTFKEANWALIEYKAQPNRSTTEMEAPHPVQDPRTTEMYFLFEERVPIDYQMAVADPKRKKTLGNLFSPKKKKAPASQILPFDPRVRPADDFDRMLFRGQQKRLTLSRADHSVSSHLWHAAEAPVSPGRTTNAIAKASPAEQDRNGGCESSSTPRKAPITPPRHIDVISKLATSSLKWEPELKSDSTSQTQTQKDDSGYAFKRQPVNLGSVDGEKSQEGTDVDIGSETELEHDLEIVSPGPIFDLTPGREPSPARYKHGEPLHFVGEEPEEEEYQTY